MSLTTGVKQKSSRKSTHQSKLTDTRPWMFVIVAVVSLVLIHSELIINREYAPEVLLIKVSSAHAGISCSADITTNATVYTVPMREIASIYEYLDSSVFTVSSESGYFLLETDLQDYYKNFAIHLRCFGINNIQLTERVITSGSDHRCLVQEKGRLLVC